MHQQLFQAYTFKKWTAYTATYTEASRLKTKLPGVFRIYWFYARVGLGFALICVVLQIALMERITHISSQSSTYLNPFLLLPTHVKCLLFERFLKQLSCLEK